MWTGNLPPAQMPLKERQAFYRREIARRTPPKTTHDEFMLKVYRALLEDETLAQMDDK